jgi:hypothetical protein
MTPQEQHAADTAHGAVAGRLADPEFSPAQFVQDQMLACPEEQRAVFLLRVAAAAASQHAGMLVALRHLGLVAENGELLPLGMDPAEILYRAAQIRDDEGKAS